jgi:hypothetical protein
MLNRRRFLAALGALPFVGRLVGKTEAPPLMRTSVGDWLLTLDSSPVFVVVEPEWGRNPARIVQEILQNAGHQVDAASFDAMAAFCDEEIECTGPIDGLSRVS